MVPGSGLLEGRACIWLVRVFTEGRAGPRGGQRGREREDGKESKEGGGKEQ